ncbi:Tyrosine recombinase XerC [Microbacterium sp. Bi98]|nr:Tyrosine recombinase XerC [Microbacterium sp. Bi98]
MTYAKELRTWFRFLDRRGVHWSDAERADVRAFQIWRTYDAQNPARVSAATWNKGWAALTHFYRWAIECKWVERSPLGKYDRLLDNRAQGAHREKNARHSRDRWITPKDFACWSLVGLSGYDSRPDSGGGLEPTMPDPQSRVRCIDRNVAFVELLLVTGLRLSEGGKLLVFELPTSVHDDVPVVGKGGKLRHFRAMHPRALHAGNAYVRTGRDRAVRRARREGRYDHVRAENMIEGIAQEKSGTQLRMGDGTKVHLLSLGQERRLQLYRRTDAGLEPAALWLSERGEPLPSPSWSKVFQAANRRLSAERLRHFGNDRGVWVTPHSLRFTFALFSLLAGVRAMDARTGRVPSDPFIAADYTQIFDEVRDLLGHANTEITRNVYLEPVKGLRRTSLLHASSAADFWEQVAGSSPLIGFGRGQE